MSTADFTKPPQITDAIKTGFSNMFGIFNKLINTDQNAACGAFGIDPNHPNAEDFLHKIQDSIAKPETMQNMMHDFGKQFANDTKALSGLLNAHNVGDIAKATEKIGEKGMDFLGSMAKKLLGGVTEELESIKKATASLGMGKGK